MHTASAGTQWLSKSLLSHLLVGQGVVEWKGIAAIPTRELPAQLSLGGLQKERGGLGLLTRANDNLQECMMQGYYAGLMQWIVLALQGLCLSPGSGSPKACLVVYLPTWLAKGLPLH